MSLLSPSLNEDPDSEYESPSGEELPRAPAWKQAIYGRPVTGSGRRRTPSTAQREALIDKQRNRCLYCDLKIGTVVQRGEYNVRLQVNWDHFIPYSYGRTNSGDNWVLACHVCNGIKGCRVFDTVVAAQEYIRQRWADKGYVAPFVAETDDAESLPDSATPATAETAWEDPEPSYEPVPLELAKVAAVVCRRLSAHLRPMSFAQICRLGGNQAPLRAALDALIESGHVKRQLRRNTSTFDYWLVRPYTVPAEAEHLPDFSWRRGGVARQRKPRSRFPGRERGES